MIFFSVAKPPTSIRINKAVTSYNGKGVIGVSATDDHLFELDCSTTTTCSWIILPQKLPKILQRNFVMMRLPHEFSCLT